MVARFTMRTHGINQAFRFVEGIWLHRKSHEIWFFFLKKMPCLHDTCATWNEQPSNIKTMGYLIFFIIKEIDLSTYFQEFLDSSNDEGSDSGENSVDLGSDLNLEHHPLHRLDQVPSIHIIKVVYYLCLSIITPLRYKRVSYFCFSLLMVLQNCERIFLPFFTINIWSNKVYIF